MPTASLTNPKLPKRTERDYLAEQAEIGWAGLAQSVQGLKQSVAKASDIRTCARHHPLVTAGSACVAGFLAGAMFLGPRPATTGDQAASKCGDLSGSSQSGSLRAKTGSMFETLGSSLTGIVQSLLQRLIREALNPQ